MKRSVSLSLAAMLLAMTLSSVQAAPLQTVIDGYVAEALDSNLALQGEQAQVDQARALLDQARARYYPELSVSARYTLNDGGRTLPFPIGDLLNPVYSTLNDMLVAQGRAAAFPLLQNQEIPLLRPQEQDTHLSLRQALYAPAINAGRDARQAMLTSAEAQRQAMRHEIRRDVTVAYLQWLQASQAVAIVDSTRQVLQENLRVLQSLHANGKVTEDQPLRARAELLNVEQQLLTTRQQQAAAQRWLNFLRNQPLDTLLTDSDVNDLGNALPAIDSAMLRDQAQRRAELGQLDAALKASAAEVQLAQAESRPTLSLGIDAGIQGDRYGFGPDYNYVSGSLLLNWKFYAGGGLRAQVSAAKASQRRLQSVRNQTEAQINLQVEQAIDRYQSARRAVSTAEARVVAAEAAYRIAGRKRDEGVISQVEYLDARNALTAAQLNLNVTRFAVRIEWAEVEYASAAPLMPVTNR